MIYDDKGNATATPEERRAIYRVIPKAAMSAVALGFSLVEATLALVPRPREGARVWCIDSPERPVPVPGVVLAVVDDEDALGGWQAFARVWPEPSRLRSKRRGRSELRAFSAVDFIPEGANGIHPRVCSYRPAA